MLSPLASTADLADFLNQPEPTNIGHWQFHLQGASDVFRAKTNQQIELVTDDEIELSGTWGRELWLPQRPVIDLTELSLRWEGETVFTDLDVTGIPFTRRGLVTYPWGESYWGSPAGTVKATYSHGYAETPSDIVTTVCSMAARGMGNPAGVSAESIGTYSVTYSTGSVGLTDAEDSVIRRYAWKAPA